MLSLSVLDNRDPIISLGNLLQCFTVLTNRKTSRYLRCNLSSPLLVWSNTFDWSWWIQFFPTSNKFRVLPQRLLLLLLCYVNSFFPPSTAASLLFPLPLCIISLQGSLPLCPLPFIFHDVCVQHICMARAKVSHSNMNRLKPTPYSEILKEIRKL